MTPRDALEDRELRLVALAAVIAVIAIGIVLLIADVFWNFLDDDVAAGIAGFIGGIVGMLAISLARWIAPGPPDDD